MTEPTIEQIRRQLSRELSRGEISEVEFDREMAELDREEEWDECQYGDDF